MEAHVLGADQHPQPAPDGQVWKCVDCGHYDKDTHVLQATGGLCEHAVILVDEPK